jgi:glutaminyl-peptide cyclotransferase
VVRYRTDTERLGFDLRPWSAIALAGTLACHGSPPPPAEVPADRLLTYVDQQLAFGPRPPGSAAHTAMAAWLDSAVRARADTVITDDWTAVTSNGDSLRLHNVLASFRPEVPDRVLYVAHWDTRPRADAAASSDSTAPVMGANDGASGVAVLLGVADAFRARQPPVGVDLLFVDGEDWGDFNDSTETLLGARRFARRVRGSYQPRLAIVWDMVGDRDQRFLKEGASVTGVPARVDSVWRCAARLGYRAQFPDSVTEAIIDDHLPLQRVGLEAIDVIDLVYGPGNRWHHTTEDTRDKISGASLARVAHLATALVRKCL